MSATGRMRVGVLLAQLGTPASTRVSDVRRYLREFLSDPRVLDIPGPARWLLLRAVILPFRPRRSAEAYRAIWGPEGSPLLVHGLALADEVAKRLGPAFRVELGMRYGEPSIAAALERLVAAGADRVTVLPLFPHYASSSTGSALARVLEEAAARWNVPQITTLGAFYDDPAFIAAVAEQARPVLASLRPDHVLLSYHGLPERQVRKSDTTGGAHCLASDACCDAIVEANRYCYRAQCYATSRALIRALGLRAEETTTAFQSRLGRTPWIRPYTDEVLGELAGRGVRRLAVACPSFVADCLETLEEIGIRGREQWRAAGGEELALIPCPNASPTFAEAVAGWIRRAA